MTSHAVACYLHPRRAAEPGEHHWRIMERQNANSHWSRRGVAQTQEHCLDARVQHPYTEEPRRLRALDRTQWSNWSEVQAHLWFSPLWLSGNSNMGELVHSMHKCFTNSGDAQALGSDWSKRFGLIEFSSRLSCRCSSRCTSADDWREVDFLFAGRLIAKRTRRAQKIELAEVELTHLCIPKLFLSYYWNLQMLCYSNIY